VSDPGHLVTEAGGGILRVTVNRPQKRNALSRAVLGDLREAFTAHAGDKSLSVAVLTGAGDKSFAAGGDLRDLEGLRTIGEAAAMADGAKAALNAIRCFPVPVVAVLNGDALGGGAELAMACDCRLAASHARIGFAQGRLNISTAWGGGIDLLQLLGPARGLGLLGRGDLLDAPAALAMGLIDAVAPRGGDLGVFVDAFITGFLGPSPHVMRAFKALSLGVRRGLPRAELEALETRLFADTWVHDDHWAAAAKLLSKGR
jgi:enoyl-CoA hydratase